jgi:hypothetical protein
MEFQRNWGRVPVSDRWCRREWLLLPRHIVVADHEGIGHELPHGPLEAPEDAGVLSVQSGELDSEIGPPRRDPPTGPAAGHRGVEADPLDPSTGELHAGTIGGERIQRRRVHRAEATAIPHGELSRREQRHLEFEVKGATP